MKIKIQSLGRAGIVYYKDKEFMNIDSEALAGSDNRHPAILIYINTIKYWMSRDGKRLATDDERKEVIKNLEIACGGPDKIEWDRTSYKDWDGNWIR